MGEGDCLAQLPDSLEKMAYVHKPFFFHMVMSHFHSMISHFRKRYLFWENYRNRQVAVAAKLAAERRRLLLLLHVVLRHQPIVVARDLLLVKQLRLPSTFPVSTLLPSLTHQIGVRIPDIFFADVILCIMRS